MNKIDHTTDLSAEKLSVEKAPLVCSKCAKPLCLRKQVINLALGNETEMYCLICLGDMEGKEAKEILLAVKDYIGGRECLQKEWSRYKDGNYCPDRYGCFFSECFSDEEIKF